MDKQGIISQIKREYELGLEYVKPIRERYRQRLLKWLPENKGKKLININMIANYIDTLIASFFSSGINVKFISRNGWIGEEEAQNLNVVASFDDREGITQQVRYQVEQDSLFFGVGILNRTGFDDVRLMNTWRAINPLSWIPDPLPTQTGQFDGQNYRFHGFTMLVNIHDVKGKYDKQAINNWFAKKYNDQETKNREAYQNKTGTGPITVDEITNNYSLDIYTHYTIIDGKKYKFVLSGDLTEIFYQEELKPVTKEEKLNPELVPRPIILNYFDPCRGNPFGNSVCDKVEDKQNAKSVLANLAVIKAKKEALGGDFLVNSRLIKNKEALLKKTVDTRYIFIDEDQLGTQPIQNAMYELPQSQIKSDVFTMMQFLDNESKVDVKIDQLQQGLVPDKSMTKAEAQQIQANANMQLSLRNTIKQWFYTDYYFQRWRGYLENFPEGKKKFAILNGDFEWKSVTLSKDEFVMKQMPYILIGTADDISAINEKQKNYLNMLYPIISQDPDIPKVSKNIFKRLVFRVNGLHPNVINSICPYTPSERQAKAYVDMINLGHKPKSIFTNPNADFFTYWLYIQKCEDNDIKDEILGLLNNYLIEQGMEGQQALMQENPVANSASNIMMSRNVPNQQELITREKATNPDLSSNVI